MNKISIIMASYNKVDFIKEAIESVIKQTYQNFELLIVDGGSTDGSLEIIKEYRSHSKIKVVVEGDNGMYHARNKGILMSTGDIIGFLNTDDFYEPKALEKINRCFQKFPNADIVYGSMSVVNKKGVFVKEYPNAKVKTKNRIPRDKHLPDQASFILRKHIDYVGLYDLHYKIAGDWDFWQRCIVLGLNIKSVPFKIANYRHYEHTLTFSEKHRNIRYIEKKRYYRKYNDCFISFFLIKLNFRYFIIQPFKRLFKLKKSYE